MREIEFRAFLKKEKIIADVTSIDYSAQTIECHNFGNKKFRNKNLGDGTLVTDGERFSLMQYTDLKDKNGKKIFEGDVVSNETIKGKVLFSGGCFVAYDKNDDFIILLRCNLQNLEIIGNIYEKPNLLSSPSER